MSAPRFQLLDAFVHAGFNLIDTADAYSKWAPGNSGGESETVIGKWLQHTRKRKDVILATKVGMEMGAGRKGLSKPYILQAVEESLRRLQTDYIDLYQSHVDDPDTPLEETLAAYDQLIREGQGPSYRRLELFRGAPFASSCREQTARVCELPEPAAALQSL